MPPSSKKKRPARDVTRLKNRRQFIATLERLMKALKANRPFRIQVEGERMLVPGDAELSVEHERSGDEEELEIQLRWTTASAAAPRPPRPRSTGRRSGSSR
jgi:amphi-Trp domain-containing protein